MARIRMRRPEVVSPLIPTASMADIAFLLLIFFLTSTIFRLENGLAVRLPAAESGERVTREDVSTIWVDRAGRMVIDDVQVDLDRVDEIMERKLGASGSLVVSLKIDREVSYGTGERLIGRLRAAGVRNVSFSSVRDLLLP